MRLHHCVLAQDFACGLCMRIIPVCHSNGYCCLFMRIPLRILYAGIPYAWRRPWRVLRDRLDETKGSDCSKRRSERLARASAFSSIPALSPRFFLSPVVAFNGLGFRTGKDAGPVAGRKSELVKSLGGHSDHANWRAYRANTRSRYAPPPAVARLWDVYKTRLVFDFSPWQHVNTCDGYYII